MQFKKLSAPLTVMALALATAINLPRSSLAQRQPRFFCGMAFGFPATIVRTEVKNVELIYWHKEIGGIPPERRCQVISRRFEEFDRNGYQYLRTGKVNGQPVICLTKYRDSSCSSSTVLITLDPQDNPEEIYRELLNTRVAAGSEGSKIYLSPPDERIEPLVEDDGFLSVDIQRIIDFFGGQGSRVFPQD